MEAFFVGISTNVRAGSSSLREQLYAVLASQVAIQQHVPL